MKGLNEDYERYRGVTTSAMQKTGLKKTKSLKETWAINGLCLCYRRSAILDSTCYGLFGPIRWNNFSSTKV